MSEADLTIEEGRIALYQLERQLKQEHQSSPKNSNIIASTENNYDIFTTTNNNNNYVDSRKHLYHERKLLDQKPRDARLNYRKGSPLGLTLEELDDRGLLDGGGIVPSYYTSIKQKSRRALEMQSRSSRMQSRGQEDFASTKILDAMMRMVYVMIKKGCNLEELFHSYDRDNQGMIEKHIFLNILKNLGLPFTSKDFSSLSKRFSVSSHHVDYDAFLREMLIIVNDSSHTREDALDGGDDSLGPGNTGGGGGSYLSHGTIIQDLRKMLKDITDTHRKTQNDVYRLFSIWDHGGTGTVTTTQFFRVLSNLNITFNDQEQDCMVELLDVGGTGRIDFDSLLMYCFSRDSNEDDHSFETTEGNGDVKALHQNYRNLEPVINMTAADVTGDESLSGDSANGGLRRNYNQTPSRDGFNVKRPHTASDMRRSDSNEVRPHVYLDDNDSYNSARDQTMTPMGYSYNSGNMSPVKNSQKQRPLTASARVLNVEYKARDSKVKDNENRHHDDPYYEDNITDDNSAGFDGRTHEDVTYTDMDLREDPNEKYAEKMIWGNGDRSAPHHQRERGFMADNQIASHTNHAYSKNSNNAHHNYEKIHIHAPPKSHSNHALLLYSDDSFENRPHHQHVQQPVANVSRGRVQTEVLTSQPKEVSTSAPSSALHVHDISQKVDSIIVQLRNILLSKFNLEFAAQNKLREKPSHVQILQSLFSDYDAKHTRYFEVDDLVEISKKFYNFIIPWNVAREVLSRIAIDGKMRVSYCEFVVFITDLTHRELIANVQHEICDQLEQQGMHYTYLLFSVLTGSANDDGDDMKEQSEGYRRHNDATADYDNNAANSAAGLVPASVFADALMKIGIDISPTDIQRLVSRMDTHGTGQCSINKFLRIVQNCTLWKDTIEALNYYEEAAEEASIVRERLENGLKHNRRYVIPTVYDKVTVDMAEYLGIRILSEPHLLWIVEEAIEAPLPEGWTSHQDSASRTFFCHAESGVTRWDHPLDRKFRQLRNLHRKRYTIDSGQSYVMGPNSLHPDAENEQNVDADNAPFTVYQKNAAASSTRRITRPDDKTIRKKPSFQNASSNNSSNQEYESTRQFAVSESRNGQVHMSSTLPPPKVIYGNFGNNILLPMPATSSRGASGSSQEYNDISSNKHQTLVDRALAQSHRSQQRSASTKQLHGSNKKNVANSSSKQSHPYLTGVRATTKDNDNRYQRSVSAGRVRSNPNEKITSDFIQQSLGRQLDKSDQLTEMFGDNILAKLDTLIDTTGKSSKDSLKQRHKQPQQQRDNIGQHNSNVDKIVDASITDIDQLVELRATELAALMKERQMIHDHRQRMQSFPNNKPHKVDKTPAASRTEYVSTSSSIPPLLVTPHPTLKGGQAQHSGGGMKYSLHTNDSSFLESNNSDIVWL